MKSKIDIYGNVRDGRLDFCFSDQTIKEIESHNGEDALISIAFPGGSVAFWQHKYYRGTLLPLIAAEAYSDNEALAHFNMKRMFLLKTDAENIADIPKKFIDRAILLMDKDILLGYIPSTGDLTMKEMNQFILDVEGIMLEFMHGIEEQGKMARDMAMGGVR